MAAVCVHGPHDELRGNDERHPRSLAAQPRLHGEVDVEGAKRDGGTRGGAERILQQDLDVYDGPRGVEGDEGMVAESAQSKRLVLCLRGTVCVCVCVCVCVVK